MRTVRDFWLHLTHRKELVSATWTNCYLDSKERGVIFGGLAEMASKTCIKFFIHKHPSEIHDDGYVFITKSRGKGCWSFVGKQGGKQVCEGL